MTDEACGPSPGPRAISNVPLHMADVGTENYDQEFTLGLIENEAGDASTRCSRPCRGSAPGLTASVRSAASRSPSRGSGLPYTKHCIQYYCGSWRVNERQGRRRRRRRTGIRDGGRRAGRWITLLGRHRAGRMAFDDHQSRSSLTDRPRRAGAGHHNVLELHQPFRRPLGPQAATSYSSLFFATASRSRRGGGVCYYNIRPQRPKPTGADRRARPDRSRRWATSTTASSSVPSTNVHFTSTRSGSAYRHLQLRRQHARRRRDHP